MVILSNFSDRLTEQMILCGLSAKQLADITGANRVTIFALKRGARLPSTQLLLSLVEHFQCSADYLLGLVEFSPEQVYYASSMQDFGERLRFLLTENKVSQYKLTKDYHISGNLIYRWLNNKAIPSVANLIKLSQCLDIPVDTLIGRIK